MNEDRRIYGTHGTYGKRIIIFAAWLVLSLALTACTGSTKGSADLAGSETNHESELLNEAGTVSQQKEQAVSEAYEKTAAAEPSSLEAETDGQIYLYGEQHGEQAIYEKEFELWDEYYRKDGLRHLFVELPYYTAEFLNLWMEAEDDMILEEVYADWEGSSAHNPYYKEFYQKIKQNCPETVFHGTDVGHQYDTTGQRYLDYLKENQLEESGQYQLASECIGQGEYFYENSDNIYRENKMAENFARAYDAIGGESIMGIYGNAHVGIDAMEYSARAVPCMANQLYASYGDRIHSEDLTWILKDIDPIRVDTVTVEGKTYQASYFGKEDLTGFKDFTYREFWRLEGAYEDFKDHPKTGEVLPYNNYPMLIETGQVFILDIGKTDGSVMRSYYRSDGNRWNGDLTTEGFPVSK